jgi:hypothetical protein
MPWPGARVIHASSPWRIVRWGAVAALLIAVALLAANVGASFVAGGHLGLIPHHLGSTIAFSAPPSPPGHGLTAIPPHAG